MRWSYFNKFSDLTDKYMPPVGEGETMASQAVTAINKLVYKWYNDGDVYDNSYLMSGWCNDLSSYANWLAKYITGAEVILMRITNCFSPEEYENILVEMCNAIFKKKLLKEFNTKKCVDSIYTCAGPFKFIEEDFIEEDEYDY